MLRFIVVSLLLTAMTAGAAQAQVGPPPQAWTSDGATPGRTRALPGDWLTPPLVQRWTREVGGTGDQRGMSDPLVAEDRVFVPSSHSGFNASGSGGSVVALDRLTGARLWERALPPGDLVYDEGTLVLVAGWDPLIAGLDPATGRTRWVRTYFATLNAPIAYGGRLYLDGAAYDMRDGASLGSPFPGPAAIDGGTAYAREYESCRPFRAFDADTWEQRWIAATPPSCPGNGPRQPMTDGNVIANEGLIRDTLTGVVLRTAGDAFPTGLADGAVIGEVRGFPDLTVAEEARSGVRRWGYEPRTREHGPTLVVGTTAWVADFGGLFAHDVRTGAQLWNLPGAFASLYTPLVAGQGTLLARTYDDGLVGLSRPGPDTRISLRPAAHTSSGTARFAFSAASAAATFECSLDGSAWATCSSPLELTDLAAGDHRLEVRSVVADERDPAPSVAAWTIDATAPAPSLDGGPTGTSTSRSATFGVRDGDTWALARCALDGAVPLPCRDQIALTGLADGEHTLTLTSRDLAGNTGSAQRTWKVDATPPETTIADGPRGRVATQRATFRMLASEAGSTFRCKLDDGAETGCASPVTYDGMADGAHRFEVAAIDAVGNRDASPAVWTWSVQGGEPDPSPTPTPEPTTTPTAEPSSTPTAEPSSTPTAEPSSTATAEPSSTATAEPSSTATTEPSSTATPAPTGDPRPVVDDAGPLTAPKVALATRVYATRLRRGLVTVRVTDVPSWMTARARLVAAGRTLASSKRLKGRGAKALRLKLAPRKRMLRHPIRKARLVVTLAAAGETVDLRRSVTIVRWSR